MKVEKVVVDKDGIKHISTDEGTIGSIPFYMIDGHWKQKSNYIDIKKYELEKMKITRDMVDYIKLCFIDFVDESRYKHVFSSRIIKVSINIPDHYTLVYGEKSIDGNLKTLKWRIEQLQEIECCLNKIKMNYEDLYYSVEFPEKYDMERESAKIEILMSINKSNLKQVKL